MFESYLLHVTDFFLILTPPLLGPQPDFSPVCDLPATQEKNRIQEDFHLVQVIYIYNGDIYFLIGLAIATHMTKLFFSKQEIYDMYGEKHNKLTEEKDLNLQVDSNQLFSYTFTILTIKTAPL